MTPQSIGLYLAGIMLGVLLFRGLFLGLQWRYYAKRDPGFAACAPDPFVLMFGLPRTWLLYDWYVEPGPVDHERGGLHAERQESRDRLREMLKWMDRCQAVEKELVAVKAELEALRKARDAKKTWEPALGDVVYAHGAGLSFVGTVMGATKADEILVRNGGGIVHTVPRSMVHKYVREDQP